MTIALPDWLEHLSFVVGADFPEADEDALWRNADAWRTAGAELRGIAPEAVVAGDRVTGALRDDAGASFAELWQGIAAPGGLAGPAGLIVQLAEACDELAAACDTIAVEVEYAKIEYIAALAVLAMTLAWMAAAAVAGGVSALGIPAAIAVAQFAIRAILLRLLTAVAVGVTFNVALDALAQGVQLAEGHRHAWDLALTTRAAQDGAIFGAVAGGTFLGLGRMAPGVMRHPLGVVGASGAAGGLGGVLAPLAHGETPDGGDIVRAVTSSLLGAGPDVVHRPLDPLSALDPTAGTAASAVLRGAEVLSAADVRPTGIEAGLGGSDAGATGAATAVDGTGWSGPVRPDATRLDAARPDATRLDGAVVLDGTARRDTAVRPDTVARPDAPGTIQPDDARVGDAGNAGIRSGDMARDAAPGSIGDRGGPAGSAVMAHSAGTAIESPRTDPVAAGAHASLAGPHAPATVHASAVPGQVGPDQAAGPPTGVPPSGAIVNAGAGAAAVGAPVVAPGGPGPGLGPDGTGVGTVGPLAYPGGPVVHAPSIQDGDAWQARAGGSGWTGERGESLSGRTNAVADALLDRARVAEPRITSSMREVASGTGGVLRGEADRLKAAGTLKEKLARVLDRNPDLARALQKLNDSVRYTIEFGEAGFAAGVRAALDGLRERGFRPVRDWSSWDPARGYVGLNTTWSDPVTGHLFEVQFHTPESFHAKSITHDLYDLLRGEDRRSAEYVNLRRLHDAYFADVPVPDGAHELGLSEMGRYDPTDDLSDPAVSRPSQVEPGSRAVTDAEARELVERTVFATAAGFAFYVGDDELRDFARAVPVTPGYVTLDLHGSPGGFQIEHGLLTPEQFAQSLRALESAGRLSLEGGLKLVSCYTAEGAGASPAAALARALGVEVLAPDQPVWTALDGSVLVSSPVVVDGVIVPVQPEDGGWVRFTADGEVDASAAPRGSTHDGATAPGRPDRSAGGGARAPDRDV